MIIPIIVSTLSTLFIVGGIIPNYANNKFENAIKENFLSKKLEVKTYSYPSFKIINGNFDRVEIKTTKAKIRNMEIDELQLIASPINLDYKLIDEVDDLSFIKKSYLEFYGSISENTFQKYINSKDIHEKINNILKFIDINLPFNLDNFYLGNINTSFNDNKLNIESTINGIGGLISIPFKISLNLKVTDKNTLEFFNLEAEVFEQNIIFEKAQNIIEKLNPIFDFNNLNSDKIKIKVNKLSFHKNKIKFNGSIIFE
ncbi:MAG: hypothetical protein KatS3mg002_1659 [Candidatus Woesearchaeota archaeon]|nr:MAG: hypothetical protein KatS3mg002_1659 [Candidatus Woesearchaeota archaeon]